MMIVKFHCVGGQSIINKNYDNTDYNCKFMEKYKATLKYIR